MKTLRAFALTVLVFLGVSNVPVQAGHFGVGINIGVPLFYHPFYPCYPWYYRPYPYYYYAPAPVVIQPAPVVQPVPVAQPVYAPPAPVPVTANSAPVNQQQTGIDKNIYQLGDASDRVRSESALQLGRLRAAQAIDPLAATLAGDRSPLVREAAARALGLIGSSKAVPALQQAAQSDADPTVRHSAEFSLDVIHARG
jgi:hypothetical protein